MCDLDESLCDDSIPSALEGIDNHVVIAMVVVGQCLDGNTNSRALDHLEIGVENTPLHSTGVVGVGAARVGEKQLALFLIQYWIFSEKRHRSLQRKKEACAGRACTGNSRIKLGCKLKEVLLTAMGHPVVNHEDDFLKSILDEHITWLPRDRAHPMYLGLPIDLVLGHALL